jgi:hypothetical protein
MISSNTLRHVESPGTTTSQYTLWSFTNGQYRNPGYFKGPAQTLFHFYEMHMCYEKTNLKVASPRNHVYHFLVLGYCTETNQSTSCILLASCLALICTGLRVLTNYIGNHYSFLLHLTTLTTELAHGRLLTEVYAKRKKPQAASTRYLHSN